MLLGGLGTPGRFGHVGEFGHHFRLQAMQLESFPSGTTLDATVWAKHRARSCVPSSSVEAGGRRRRGAPPAARAPPPGALPSRPLFHHQG